MKVASDVAYEVAPDSTLYVAYSAVVDSAHICDILAHMGDSDGIHAHAFITSARLVMLASVAFTWLACSVLSISLLISLSMVSFLPFLIS